MTVMTTIPFTSDVALAAPKVLLHDHLDGGLRPGTVVELAAGVRLRTGCPPTTPTSWAAGSSRRPAAGRSRRYLETFAHTVGVMQTREALVRVAAECAEDLAADGVVYAEVRYAPELHVERGLGLPEVVEAVQDGFRAGRARGALEAGRPIRIGDAAHRDAARRPLARRSPSSRSRYRDDGVVGFDIAGAEAGFPPDPAPRRLRVPPARERPLHDPRRRGVRAAVDLGGAAVVRRRPARARRAHRRRHRRG